MESVPVLPYNRNLVPNDVFPGVLFYVSDDLVLNLYDPSTEKKAQVQLKETDLDDCYYDLWHEVKQKVAEQNFP